MTNKALTLAQLKEDPDRLLDQAELCAFLRKTKKWAERKRWERSGPAFHKFGRTVMYRAADVVSWFEAGRVNTNQAA